MNGVFLAAWFVASAGFAKWLAMGENLVHGYGIRRPILQRIRTMHNVLLFGIPLLVFYGLGVSGPQLLWTSAWHHVGPLGWAALGLGWCGFVVLILTTLRYQRHRPPACQTGASEHVVDLAARHPGELIGDGRARWLAGLPCNEQFTLEVNEKTFVLPRLPKEWDGVSIVHFSDAHFRGSVTRKYFEAVADEALALRGDLIAFTGDLLDKKDCLDWLPTTFGRLTAPVGCFFVLGNHDWYLGMDGETRAAFERHGWMNVAGRVQTLHRDGAGILLCGSERPWMGMPPDLTAHDPSLFRLLLSHGPDQIRWAQRQNIDLLLAGHTHGGQIRLPIIGPVYAPSRHDTRYASGVFWEPPTLMHVTRGLSGREPIRYNCRPELTKLILRSAALSPPR